MAVTRNGSVSDLSVGNWLAAADCTSINYCRSVDMAQSEPQVAAESVSFAGGSLALHGPPQAELSKKKSSSSWWYRMW